MLNFLLFTQYLGRYYIFWSILTLKIGKKTRRCSSTVQSLCAYHLLIFFFFFCLHKNFLWEKKMSESQMSAVPEIFKLVHLAATTILRSKSLRSFFPPFPPYSDVWHDVYSLLFIISRLYFTKNNITRKILFLFLWIKCINRFLHWWRKLVVRETILFDLKGHDQDMHVTARLVSQTEEGISKTQQQFQVRE